MATVVHFEIPADDTERAVKFYQSLFGWKMEKMKPAAGACGDYWYFTTEKEGKESICGGIMKRQCETHRPTNYIEVPSVDEAVKKLEELGGKKVFEKTAVPGHGYFICCVDTENNSFALWEDDKEAK